MDRREQIAAIVADAINRFKDARISGNEDVWAGSGSTSVTDAVDAILALSAPTGEDEGLIERVMATVDAAQHDTTYFVVDDVRQVAQRLSVLLGGGDSSSSSESARAEPHSSALTEAQSQAGGLAAHPGVENLRCNQRQLDEDGIEVAVSRQAVDETLFEHDQWRRQTYRLAEALTEATEWIEDNTTGPHGIGRPADPWLRDLQTLAANRGRQT